MQILVHEYTIVCITTESAQLLFYKFTTEITAKPTIVHQSFSCTVYCCTELYSVKMFICLADV